MPPTTTITCLFYTSQGSLSVKLIPQPVPAEWDDSVQMPMGVMHAVKLLGMQPPAGRKFKRTADGAIPVFEETT